MRGRRRLRVRRPRHPGAGRLGARRTAVDADPPAARSAMASAWTGSRSSPSGQSSTARPPTQSGARCRSTSRSSGSDAGLRPGCCAPPMRRRLPASRGPAGRRRTATSSSRPSSPSSSTRTTPRPRWPGRLSGLPVQSDGHFLVAERDGSVVAFAQFGVGTRGPELSRIYADPAHYGTGAGSALLEELHRRLEGQVEAYVLEVHSKNERGRAFYDRNGFVIVGDEGRMPGCDLVLRRTLRPVRATMPVETDRLRPASARAGRRGAPLRDLRRRRDDAPRRPHRAAGRRPRRHAPGRGGDPPAPGVPRLRAVGARRARRLAAGRRRGPGLGRGPWPGGRGRVHPAPRPLGTRIRHRGAPGRASNRSRASLGSSGSSRWRTSRTTRRGG